MMFGVDIMKKWIKSAVAIGGTVVASQFVIKKVSNRTMKSQVLEWMIETLNRSPKFDDFESKYDYVNELYEVNAKRYELPKLFKEKSKLERYQIDEMPVFKFSRNLDDDIGILYLHGGAYIHQPSIFHYRFIDELVQTTGVTVEMPIYPKAPNDIFVRSYELIIDLYHRMVEEYDSVMIIGDSAGGGLAVGLMQLIKEQNVKQPIHTFLISPWVDITMENEQITPQLQDDDPMLNIESLKFSGELWSGHVDKKHYLLSPTYGDLQHLPPISIFVGTREILLPDIRLFNKKLQLCNGKVEYHEFVNQNHAFPLYPIEEAKTVKKILHHTILMYDKREN